jgi:hypothetical protein
MPATVSAVISSTRILPKYGGWWTHMLRVRKESVAPTHCGERAGARASRPQTRYAGGDPAQNHNRISRLTFLDLTGVATVGRAAAPA